MTTVYNIIISLYHLLIRFAALFNEKARQWVDGRKDIFKKLETTFSTHPQLPTPNSQLIWFHCASLGEFEQGRPLMEKLKSQNEKLKIVLTFFSPSGYEIRKNYKGADYVFYLPMDSKANAEKFISIVNPSIAVFVKYEFWFHYLNELKKRNIPTFLISANFRHDQHFFQWYGAWFRKMLHLFTHIFVQNENSKYLLEKIDLKTVSVSGDTRFDRVYEIMKSAEEIPLVKIFKQNKKVLIAGSTWAADEKILTEFINLKSKILNLKYILVPHEIHESRINSLIRSFAHLKIIRFSQANEQNVVDAEVLIIDNIGMLSRIYRYGNIAYIGGGFDSGIHNILEAAVFGMPVIFGPNFSKFREAVDLIDKGGAFSISNYEELESRMNFLLRDEMILMIASEMSRNFVQSNVGATQKIIEEMKKYL